LRKIGFPPDRFFQFTFKASSSGVMYDAHFADSGVAAASKAK
jgi:hypothetical protein